MAVSQWVKRSHEACLSSKSEWSTKAARGNFSYLLWIIPMLTGHPRKFTVAGPLVYTPTTLFLYGVPAQLQYLFYLQDVSGVATAQKFWFFVSFCFCYVALSCVAWRVLRLYVGLEWCRLLWGWPISWGICHQFQDTRAGPWTSVLLAKSFGLQGEKRRNRKKTHVKRQKRV